MSSLTLVISGVMAARLGCASSEPSTKPSLSLIPNRGIKLAFLKLPGVTALALALLILAAVLPRPSQAASGAWSSAGSMNVARYSHTATLLPNGQVLVAGGGEGISTRFNSAELFNPADGTWSFTGSMATARSNHTSTLLPNGQVLVAGGWSTTGSTASAEIYDSATGWTTTASMGAARVGHTSTLLPNGQVLVAGGDYLASAELYDPDANGGAGAWTPTGNMTTNRMYHTATLLPSGQVLVAGGLSWFPFPGGGGHAIDIADADLYDPASGTWSSTGPLGSGRDSHTATLLSNSWGQVLVAGGWSGFYNSTLASAESYMQSWFGFAPTGSLATARNNHTATLLPNGQVLVAGGYNYAIPAIPYAWLNSAELYNQPLYSATGTWSSTGSMATGRTRHTATLLPNSKVLVTGGVVAVNGVTTASAELYEPEPPPKVKLPRLLAFYAFEGNGLPVPGYEGKGYSFNGTTDFLTVPLNINPGKYPKLTMGAWTKPASIGGIQPILTHDDGGYDRQIGLDTRGGGIGWSAFCGAGGGVLGAVPAIKDKWTFLAVVYDQAAQTVKLQVDDMVLTKTGVALGEGQNQVNIGASPLYSNFFHGIMDNVFVFGDALTDQQLAYIRSGGARAILTARKTTPGLLLLLMN
ncbi:MAG: kelch repeat-containing protein [Thermodesulfobacteriota bacterium]